MRVDIPCQMLGFTPPPCPVRVRFLRIGSQWTLCIGAPPGRPPDVARWIRGFAPDAVEVATGIAPKGLEAHFSRAPRAWQPLLSLEVEGLLIRPSGSATLFTPDTDAVERMVAAAEFPILAREVAPGLPPNTVSQALTPRQQEALDLAVALGYYEVPRRIYLHDLASRLGVSTGAASELLRRGESALIQEAVDVWAIGSCQ